MATSSCCKTPDSASFDAFCLVRARRGAALVEAVIVLGMIASFTVAAQSFVRVYERRSLAVSNARVAAWKEALNGCDPDNTTRRTLLSLARNGGDRRPHSFVLRAPVARITRSDVRAAHESSGDRGLTHTEMEPVSLPCNEPALPTSEELPGMRDYYLQRLLPHSSLLTSRNAHD